MLKIGVMGLGSIAQKAYLPVMISAHDECEWHFYTRNKEVLSGLKEKYNLHHTYSDYPTFLNSGLDAVMIHTPTETHYDYIKEFLNKGIHVYVDKPISDDIDQVQECIELAKEKNLVFMTGFNRRFSPIVQRLKDVPEKNLILVQKHRTYMKDSRKHAIFDTMIHSIDTALYLLDEPVINQVNTVTENDDELISATIILETEHSKALVIMNLQSGANSETIEVMSPQGHYICHDLNSLTIKDSSRNIVEPFGDWTPTLEKRGFEDIIHHFISCVSRGIQSEILTLDDAIQTHQISQKLIDLK